MIEEYAWKGRDKPGYVLPYIPNLMDLLTELEVERAQTDIVW